MFCHDGAVTFAAVGAGADLGDILQRGGLVTADRWAQVVDSSDPRVGLAELFGSGSIDAERIHRFFSRHTEETIFELDRWTSGELRLDVDDDHPLGDHFTRPDGRGARVDGDAVTVWVDLLRRIGSIDRIVHQAPMDARRHRRDARQPHPAHVLSHIDGRRSMRELARFLRTGLFHTARPSPTCVRRRPRRAQRRPVGQRRRRRGIHPAVRMLTVQASPHALGTG